MTDPNKQKIERLVGKNKNEIKSLRRRAKVYWRMSYEQSALIMQARIHILKKQNRRLREILKEWE